MDKFKFWKQWVKHFLGKIALYLQHFTCNTGNPQL